MKINETLRTIRKDKGITQAQVAEFLTERGVEVTQRAVSKWESGHTQPNTEQFLLLCELYDIRDVLSIFKGKSGLLDTLNARGRSRVKEYIRLLEADEAFAFSVNKQPERIIRTLPLYELPVSAGTGQFLDSDKYELIEVDESVPLSASFAVRISGDSMTPRYEDGQVIYIKQQQTIEDSECGVFSLNGNAYCKVLSRDTDIRLISLNSKYSPISVEEYDEFRVIGKVVASQSETAPLRRVLSVD